MKKKIALVTAVIMIIAVAAVALVSCSSTPSKFYENFKNAKSYTLSSGGEDSSTEMIYDDGSASFITKDKDGNVVMGSVAVVNDKAVALYTYNGITKKWDLLEVNTDSKLYKNVIEMVKSGLGETTVSDDDYVKEGGYWFPKELDGEASKDLAMKFTANKAEQYKVTEKDGKKEYTLVSTMTLSGSVKAPKNN